MRRMDRRDIRRLGIALVLCFSAVPPVAAADFVELDYRLRPDRDQISEQVDENVITMRVVTDKGMVARLTANGARYPLTYHTVSRQRARFTSGSAQPDGSFPAKLVVLSRQMNLSLASGEERAMPGQLPLDNLVFDAVIDPQGRVLQPRLVAEGVDALMLDNVKGVLTSVLEQVTRVEAIRVETTKATEQVMNIQVPVPGLPPLDLRLTASNRLIEIQDGTARIEMLYVMDFGIPNGPIKLEASGTGGGMMLYDVASKVVRRNETSTLMTVLIHMADGTMEQQINMRQTQNMKDAPQ